MKATGKRDVTEPSKKITFARGLMGLMLSKGGFARFGYLLG